MARTSAPHSASAQFFINVKDNDFLNAAAAQDGWGYAVFGKVISGMEVVTEIAKLPAGPGGPFRSDVDGRRCERWVLPDWYERGGYLSIDETGPRLVSF